MDREHSMDGLSKDAMALFGTFGAAPSSDKKQATQPQQDPVDVSSLSKADRLAHEHEKESKKWTAIIHEMSEKMRDNQKIGDVQSDIYDRRQQIAERKSEIARVRAKYESIYKKKRHDRMDYYATRYDRKLTAGERDKMVDSDMSEFKLILDLMDVQFDWALDTLRTITDMSYGVRNRIDVDDALRRH